MTTFKAKHIGCCHDLKYAPLTDGSPVILPPLIARVEVGVARGVAEIFLDCHLYCLITNADFRDGGKPIWCVGGVGSPMREGRNVDLYSVALAAKVAHIGGVDLDAVSLRFGLCGVGWESYDLVDA